MLSNEIALGFFFLFQIGIGTLGNSFLLGLYIIIFLTGTRRRPIDLLFAHLVFVNDLMLLFKGIPQTMAAFGLKNFLDDVGCKLVLYFYKVARDLSLSTTCLLSGFRVINLGPPRGSSSQWAKLKARAPKYIIPICFLCWTFHLLTNCMIFSYIKASNRSKNISEGKEIIYCTAAFAVPFVAVMHTLLLSLPDVVYLATMIVSSGYMVSVLYRHHQKVQNIHSHSLTPNGSPETKATQTILLLVILFVFFYSLNSILILCIHFGKSSFWLVHLSTFLAACFPACSSFVLIAGDSQIHKYYLELCKY